MCYCVESCEVPCNVEGECTGIEQCDCTEGWTIPQCSTTDETIGDFIITLTTWVEGYSSVCVCIFVCECVYMHLPNKNSYSWKFLSKLKIWEFENYQLKH